MANNFKRYESLVENTIAVAFLGTPHRGADLANILRGLLNMTFSRTRFVKDLSPTSQSIKEINETFCERISGMKLVSFWESIAMPIVGVFSLPLMKLIQTR